LSQAGVREDDRTEAPSSENDVMSIDEASKARRMVPAPAPSNPRLRPAVLDLTTL
jgi:hypothetical protein